MVLFFFLLPFTRHGLVSALSGLILPRFFFEFATVSNFPLLSEQYPAKRGKILSLGVAGGLVGTTVAATTGPLAYMTLGLWGLGLPAGVAGLFSLCLILFVVKDQPCEQDS
jgi:predicted MFS family arabinose efflux permease